MLRAIIFDFDGVIVDSEAHHLKAFQEVLKEEGVTLSDADYYAAYLGLDDRACFRAVLQERGRTPDAVEITRLIERKRRYYDRRKDDIAILPGAPRFVRQAARRYPLAIGSGALRHEIDYALDRASIASCFTVIVSAEDVARSKPAPDCYLTVLERLNARREPGVPPLKAAECVVIEDAVHGIAAARAAGMRCIGVTSSFTAENLRDADLVVPGLNVLTLEQAGAACEDRP